MTRRPSLTFLGAGSVVFTRELLGDILGFPELADVRIVLHDIDPERLATGEAIARATAAALRVHPEIVTSLDRRAALDGADYVINSIQVGMHAATVRDFEVPASFGLRQTIGDTLGVGGIFRGLRTFPVLDGIARDMTEICPNAWLLNYTNPMAMNVAYLAAVAPRLKVLGLCHSVYWTVRGLCDDLILNRAPEALTKFIQHFEAVTLWQTEVEQDQVVVLVAQRLVRHAAIPDPVDGIVLLAQYLQQCFANHGIVFNQQ